jgi:glycosyltransferase involved in cell wall biosynthesis
LARDSIIRRHERAPRSRVLQYYRDADVFLFPTHSDGFGLTQIEALESGLPVIASRNCAAVVEHGRTGLLLDEVSPEVIARAICTCLDQPEMLARMSVAAHTAAAEYANRSARAFLAAVEDVVQPVHQ